MLRVKLADGLAGTPALEEGPGSGALVQGSEKVPSLQERGASWYRNVHLTVISGQFGQQVGFKRGPEQPACHT